MFEDNVYLKKVVSELNIDALKTNEKIDAILGVKKTAEKVGHKKL